MPKKLPQGRVATADQIATLLRIYRAAASSGDESLRLASASELRSKYGIDVAELMQSGAPDLTRKGGQQ